MKYVGVPDRSLKLYRAGWSYQEWGRAKVSLICYTNSVIPACWTMKVKTINYLQL